MNESESLENDEKLLDTMLEMQQELEEQRTELEVRERKLSDQMQINSQQQETISGLSSQVLMLKSALEEKSQKIVFLNDQIYSNEKQSEKQMQILKEKYEKTKNEAERSKQEADRIRILFSRENDAMVKDRDRQIREMRTEINLGIVCLMLLLACASSARLYAIQIGQNIMDYALWVFDRLLAWSGGIAGISENIPYEILQIPLYWGIRAIVVAGLVLFFYVLPVTLIVGIILWYARSSYFDKINRGIMAVTMMVVIVLVSVQRVSIGINLLLLWGITQCLVPVVRLVIPAIVRWAIMKWRNAREETKRNVKAGLIMAGGLTGTVLLAVNLF